MKKVLQTFKQQSIFHKSNGGYREYRIPGILCAQNNVYLVCEARAENAGDWGDIDIVVSRLERDGTVKELLKLGQSHLTKDGSMRTFNNPVLVPDGECIHLIYHRNYERAYITTTQNGGETWSNSREITYAYREFPFEWNVCATGPGHGIQLRNGKLIAPIWLANGRVDEDDMTRNHWPSVAGCIYSDDHGKTWHAGALTADIQNANETTVAELDDGQLMFNFRTCEDHKRRVLGLSDDAGASIGRYWQPEELPDPQCFGGSISVGGRVLFVNCHSETDRVNLTIHASTDSGKTWEMLWKIDPVAGYADIGTLDSRLYVFYERGTDIVEELVLFVSEKLD